MKKTLHELAKEFPDKTYRELERYRNEDRHQEAGACIMGEMRKDREIDWQEKYNKEHKLRLEAEGETHLVKAVGMNSPEMKEVKAKLKEVELGLANALQINESHQKLNGKLQERVTELEEDNKKMHEHLDKRIESARKAGL
tara:strand:- start:840 stop:1262 length:423 start_codon:yes stop_codon:yes gene_type:complete